MSRIIKVKNNMLTGGTWVGISIPSGTYYTIPETDLDAWAQDSDVFASVGAGDLIVNKGADVTDDIANPVEGWSWIIGDTLPKSNLGNKLAIHSSTKPVITGKEFYLVWTGAGDDVTNGVLGGDAPLVFNMTPGVPVVTKDVRFDPQFGDVYLHEGYFSSSGAGIGDYLHSEVVADPTQLQQTSALDLIVDANGWVKAAASPGMGTHGFVGNPVLIPRTYSKDGDWDYDSVNGLTANTAGTGLYKISTSEQVVHKYINKIPLLTSNTCYNRLTSDETAFLPSGCFIRIRVHNISNGTWDAAVFMEVYRERTI